MWVPPPKPTPLLSSLARSNDLIYTSIFHLLPATCIFLISISHFSFSSDSPHLLQTPTIPSISHKDHPFLHLPLSPQILPHLPFLLKDSTKSQSPPLALYSPPATTNHQIHNTENHHNHHHKNQIKIKSKTRLKT